MTLRRMLLSGLTALLLSGTALANPPGASGTLPEGRELDPIAREYYLPIPVSEPAQNRAVSRPGDMVGSFIGAMCEVLFRELTIPLGTVRPDGGSR